MTWNELITQAFVDLATIQPGDTLSTTLQTNAQPLLNALLSSLSTEQLTAFQQVQQAFTLSVNQPSYTLGPGGTLATALRAMRVTAWKATYGDMQKGGPVLPMDAFGAAAAAAQEDLAEKTKQALMAGIITSFPFQLTAPVPSLLGADTSYPLLNVRIWPPPSAPGTLELSYYTPITQIADFTQPIVMPDGWILMLHWALAVQLYPYYARPGQTIEVIAANAQSAKAALVAQNAPGTPGQAAQ